MRALPILSALLFTTAATAPASAQVVNPLDATSLQQKAVDRDTQADDVQLREDRHQRMTVDVRVGGRGPFRFLVDTGANRTAVSRDVAASLGLTAGEPAVLHSVAGISAVSTAALPDLQFSRSGVDIAGAPVLDGNRIGADGILGTDSLRSQRVMFDFQKNVMTIVPAAEPVQPKEEGTIVVRGKLRNGRLIVTNAVADGNDITVVIDTGSDVSIGNDALRRRLAHSGFVTSTGAAELQAVTGATLKGELTFVKELELGDVKLLKLAVVFADAHTFRKLGLEKRPALLLGMNALRGFEKVSIDFANRKLRVMLPETGALDRVMMAAR